MISPGVAGHAFQNSFDFFKESIPQFGASLLIVVLESSSQIFLKQAVEYDGHRSSSVIPLDILPRTTRARVIFQLFRAALGFRNTVIFVYEDGR